MNAGDANQHGLTTPSLGADGNSGREHAGAETEQGERAFSSLRQAPLLPEAGASGAPLIAVIAVISALAALALSAFLLIASATKIWTDELASSLTVQVKGADAEEIEARALAAAALLGEIEGVRSVRVASAQEAAKLLEPWLGKGNSDFLNVPALIEVTADPTLRRDLDAVRDRLAQEVPGAILDDHSEWNQRLTSAARSGQALAFAVFALILGAACAIAAFAARAGLAANAQIVNLLHIIGATDEFIAGEVQRRFLSIGLRGSLIGLGLAMLTVFSFAYVTRAQGASEYLLPGVSITWDMMLPILIVPLTLCLAVAVTARLTILNSLKSQL